MALAGRNASFSLGSNEVASLTSITNDITGDTLDTTVFGVDFKTFIAGLRGGTITISGFYDSTDTAGQVAMRTAILAGTLLTTTQKPVFSVDGTNGFTADGIISSMSTGAEVAGLVSFSATIQLSGTIAVV